MKGMSGVMPVYIVTSYTVWLVSLFVVILCWFDECFPFSLLLFAASFFFLFFWGGGGRGGMFFSFFVLFVAACVSLLLGGVTSIKTGFDMKVQDPSMTNIRGGGGGGAKSILVHVCERFANVNIMVQICEESSNVTPKTGGSAL